MVLFVEAAKVSKRAQISRYSEKTYRRPPPSMRNRLLLEEWRPENDDKPSRGFLAHNEPPSSQREHAPRKNGRKSLRTCRKQAETAENQPRPFTDHI